jgi:hypothetical protein
MLFTLCADYTPSKDQFPVHPANPVILSKNPAAVIDAPLQLS